MPLTAPRYIQQRADSDLNNFVTLGVKTGTTLFVGGIVCTDSTGYAVPGQTATGLKAWGILGRTPLSVPIQGSVTNSGASGAISVDVLQGAFYLDNSGTDPVSITNIGALVYMSDDHTVCATNGSSTRSVLGEMLGLDPVTGFVLVQIGQALE